MGKKFELDRMVNTNYKNSLGLFLSTNKYQANRHCVDFPESMRKQLSCNRVQHQHSNTPVLQHSGIWYKEDLYVA